MSMQHVDAPISFEINGNTYLLSRPQKKDFLEILNFIKFEPLESASESLSELPTGIREVAVKQYIQIGEERAASLDLASAMGSPSVQGFFFYLLLRRKHPDMNREQAMSLWAELLETGQHEEIEAKINALIDADTGSSTSAPADGEAADADPLS